MTESIYIVMPAYNEEENIEKVIREWHYVCKRITDMGAVACLVIANDGSKDSTYEKMMYLRADNPYLVVLDKPNSGHGATVHYLYRYAISHGASFIFQTDSDGQTRPEDFWQMWENLNMYDFQIGTRNGRQDGFFRLAVSKVLCMVVWMVFHVWVKDPNCPFRLMESKKLSEVLKVIPEDFFLVNVAISAILTRWKEPIAWHPITFRARQGGENSINMKQIIKIGVQSFVGLISINQRIKK